MHGVVSLLETAEGALVGGSLQNQLQQHGRAFRDFLFGLGLAAFGVEAGAATGTALSHRRRQFVSNLLGTMVHGESATED